MVGLFGRSTKGFPPRSSRNSDAANPPPPPYSQDNSDPAVYTTEMTTTTTTHLVMTTTQTTTHFFSLPMWRRRGTQVYSPRDQATRSTDELGLAHVHPGPSTSSTVHSREKDLPPTPELSSGDLTPPNLLSPDTPSQHERDDAMHSVGKHSSSRSGPASAASSRASSLQPISRSSYAPSDSPNSTQPTVVLARAALGLGLPHAAPATVSPSSSTTDINTVTFFPHSPSMTDLRRSALRHAKSFHAEPETTAGEPPQSLVRERRRTRGLSLGPLNLLSSDPKGKQRETGHNSGPSGTKPLTRKSSFWSRKRVNSRPESAFAPPSPTPQPTLPAFPPISPFNMNTSVQSPGLSVTQSPELQRRHSERTRKQSLGREDQEPQAGGSPKSPNPTIHARRRRGSQRPQTADSAATGPCLSFLLESGPIVSSPPSSPLPTPLEQPASAPAPEPRSRAQTNPPLLHRLSVNLFGGPSSSNTHTPTSTSSPNILDGQGVTSPPSSLGSSRPSLSLKPSVEIPRPNSDEETPEGYLQRLVEAVSKAEVATVLASRSARLIVPIEDWTKFCLQRGCISRPSAPCLYRALQLRRRPTRCCGTEAAHGCWPTPRDTTDRPRD